MNEELQSTNEELESMHEELHASNEELETSNDELRARGDELNRVNAFMDTILRSVNVGVIVLDQSLQVQVWNHAAEETWGLRAEEAIGQPFLALEGAREGAPAHAGGIGPFVDRRMR